MRRIRVAYAGYDFFSSCLAMLIDLPDVDVVLCLTGPRDDGGIANVLRLAEASHANVIFGRPSAAAIDTINRIRPDLLVSAAYSYRIPIEDIHVQWSANVHPSLLPDGRGPNPLPHLVSGHRSSAGVTIHELSPEFDRGPIYFREGISLDEHDGFDTLSLKLFAIAPIVLARLVESLRAGIIPKKVDQGAGSYWPAPTEGDRTVDASVARCDEVRELHRRFGTLGLVFALSDGTRLRAAHVSVAETPSLYDAGTMVARLGLGVVIALSDGLVRLGDCEFEA